MLKLLITALTLVLFAGCYEGTIYERRSHRTYYYDDGPSYRVRYARSRPYYRRGHPVYRSRYYSRRPVYRSRRVYRYY